MKKLEEKELKQLVEVINNINSLQGQIGGFEAEKYKLLHALTSATTDLSKLQQELEQKYGKVSINIQTGEISEADESNQEN